MPMVTIKAMKMVRLTGFGSTREDGFPLTGNQRQEVVTIYWGTPDLEQGRTEYDLSAGTSMKVSDYVLRNGAYTLFGEAVYQRSR